MSITIVDVHVDSSWSKVSDLVAYINPRITWSSDEIIHGIEGCYSVDDHLDGKVPRAKSSKLEAYDRQGNLIQQTYSGFTAVAALHWRETYFLERAFHVSSFFKVDISKL